MLKTFDTSFEIFSKKTSFQELRTSINALLSVVFEMADCYMNFRRKVLAWINFTVIVGVAIPPINGLSSQQLLWAWKLLSAKSCNDVREKCLQKWSNLQRTSRNVSRRGGKFVMKEWMENFVHIIQHKLKFLIQKLRYCSELTSFCSITCFRQNRQQLQSKSAITTTLHIYSLLLIYIRRIILIT